MFRYIAIFFCFFVFFQSSYATVGDETYQVLNTIGEGQWVKLNSNLFSNVWTPSNQRPQKFKVLLVRLIELLKLGVQWHGIKSAKH
jgi:hypothetical protein